MVTFQLVGWISDHNVHFATFTMITFSLFRYSIRIYIIYLCHIDSCSSRPVGGPADPASIYI